VGCRKVCECVGCRTGAASHAKEGGRHKDMINYNYQTNGTIRRGSQLNNKETHAASLSPTHTPFLFLYLYSHLVSPPFLSYLRTLHPQPNRVPRHITRISREQQNTHAAKQNTDKFSLAFPSFNFHLHLIVFPPSLQIWGHPTHIRSNSLVIIPIKSCLSSATLNYHYVSTSIYTLLLCFCLSSISFSS